MNRANTKNTVLILGGGISGLSTAWFLHKRNIPFKLIEKKPSVGGMISSSVREGTVMDFGPNSLRDREGVIRELVKDVGLEDEIIEISEAFKTRFIVRDKELQALKPSIKTLLTTKVLSGSGKLRMLAEPFIPKGTSEDESVGAFLERRIGKEAVEYLVDPVFSGIYAGDIYQISKKEILPKLAENEQEFGSLVMGAFRSKKQKSGVKPIVLSLNNGIQQLTDAIAEKLPNNILYEEVQSIKKESHEFEVKTSGQVHMASTVISCMPAYSLAEVLSNFSPELSDTLQKIEYAPMLSTQLIFDRKEIAFPHSGFGFLIPRKENIRLLGAIWKTSIFPQLTEDGKYHFTLMTGGALDRKILNEEVPTVEKEILKEFKDLTGISADPKKVRSFLWEKAIPQFHVGYQLIRDTMKETERKNPGFNLGGNYRWGVSVPDCVKGAKELVDTIF